MDVSIDTPVAKCRVGEKVGAIEAGKNVELKFLMI